MYNVKKLYPICIKIIFLYADSDDLPSSKQILKKKQVYDLNLDHKTPENVQHSMAIMHCTQQLQSCDIFRN